MALVELNPLVKDKMKKTWKDYDLVQQTESQPYRREITWSVFDEKANRVANMLISRGVQQGDRVAILMFNCLEWLPIYFGILKTGAIAVPFNFRFDAEEIKYCADLAEVQVLFFGPEFIGRIESIEEELSKGGLLIYVGDGCLHENMVTGITVHAKEVVCVVDAMKFYINNPDRKSGV